MTVSKLVDWLLVFTAGYWSLALGYLFLLLENGADGEPGSLALEADLAEGGGVGDGRQPEDLHAVATEDHVAATEPLVAGADVDLEAVELVQADGPILCQTQSSVNDHAAVGNAVASIDVGHHLPDVGAQADGDRQQGPELPQS